jgi:hypothetical protein
MMSPIAVNVIAVLPAPTGANTNARSFSYKKSAASSW